MFDKLAVVKILTAQIRKKNDSRTSQFANYFNNVTSICVIIVKQNISYCSLIELGANIELRNTKQWTPLDCACAFGFVKPAKALLEAGATIEPSGKIKVS